MRDIRWYGAALAGFLAASAAGAQSLSSDMPYDVGNLPAPKAGDWDTFAWQSFMAANWPVAQGTRGTPDTSQKIGAVDGGGMPVPVVWMTSKSPNDVFLAQGAPPDPNWQTQATVSECQSLPGYDPATSYVLGMVSKTAPQAFTAIDQAPFPGSKQVVGPVVDQAGNYIRYDIRMSQSEFEYFLTYQYYNAANQIAAVQSNPITFQPPPRGGESYLQKLPQNAQYGTVEYKASWRVLDPQVDIVSRYFRVNAFMVNPDGKCFGPQLMGLTGLHILRLTPSTPATWFWATFEQVDNLTVPNPPPTRPNGQPLTPTLGDGKTYPAGYKLPMPPVVQPGLPLPPGTPVPVSRLTPIHDDAVPVTQSFQKLLAGTVWENYQLIGTQFPVNPIQNGQPQGNGKGKGQCYAAGTGNENNAKFQINDCYLANVSMETYVQSTSCVTCHSFGAPQGVPLATKTPTPRPTFNALANFQIFSFMLLQAKAPGNN